MRAPTVHPAGWLNVSSLRPHRVIPHCTQSHALHTQPPPSQPDPIPSTRPAPAGGVPIDLEVPPPRPKRKAAKPYPRKVDGFSDIVNQVGTALLPSRRTSLGD